MKIECLMKKFILLVSIVCIAACSTLKSGNSFGKGSGRESFPSRTMLDGRIWTSVNLQISVPDSFCKGDDSAFCAQYGRFYTWEAAKKACSQLGEEWRLPTNEEWAILAKSYGGIYGEAGDNGKSAYLALTEGGSAGFNAFLAGNREADGTYARFGAHGFYWTATEKDSSEAWFINFAKGAPLLNRHTGDKNRALSVRCILD